MLIIEKEFNALTGEETITEREETASEKTERLTIEKWIAEQAAEAEVKAEEEKKAVAQAKLAALGLTVEDLQALGL
jgi:hypothetical protein